jgi:hypothetical protein
MATRINIDVVPEVGRPPEIEAALADARTLVGKRQEAEAALTSAKAALEQAQADDVARTAEKVRQGEQPGAVAASVTKAKSAVELATRNTAAIQRAR